MPTTPINAGQAPDPDTPLGLLGWVDHPDRQAVGATVGGTISQDAPHLMQSAPDGNILLYKAFKDVLGDYIHYGRQEIGDCVSMGHGHGNDLLQCIEAALVGLKLTREDVETDTEFIYGAGREVGGMLGGGDGCYGSAAVKAMKEIGMVPRSLVGPYAGSRAKQWGRSGPPAALKSTAARFRLGSAALVTTWDELLAAMGNGYPVTICSNQGFTMQRDDQGFCQPRGHWGHCMHLIGLRQDSRPGACIRQSWGPNTPSGPTVLDQPDDSFWADRHVIESILAAQDSWALAKTPYFVDRPIPAHWTYAEFI